MIKRGRLAIRRPEVQRANSDLDSLLQMALKAARAALSPPYRRRLGESSLPVPSVTVSKFCGADLLRKCIPVTAIRDSKKRGTIYR